MRLWPSRGADLGAAMGGGGAGGAGDLRPRLLDPARLGRYDALALRVRRGMGERPGDRRVPGHPQPSGIELEAHSAYAPGDDLRHLDWNALGRLDTLLVRRFTAEREVTVHVVLDASASLAVPAGDDKLWTACELAMALAYVALRAGDAVRMAALRGDDDDDGATRVFRQRASIARVAERLAAVRPAGHLDLAAALARYTARHRAPGLALLISDFLVEPAGVERAVHALRARGYESHLLHVVGPSELDPRRAFTRGILVDVESADTRSIALTPGTLARYTAVFAAHCDALAALADRNQASYARLVAGADVAAFLMGPLAQTGLVRRR